MEEKKSQNKIGKRWKENKKKKKQITENKRGDRTRAIERRNKS